MKKTESGCIILKNSEYKELLAKANENKQKEIKISYKIGYYNETSLNISGDFELSGKLYQQIFRILNVSKEKTNLAVTELWNIKASDERSIVREEDLRLFENLSLFKRIFFKASKGITQ